MELRIPRGAASPGDHRAELLARIASRDVRAGVVGLGYVGLPLAVEMARSEFRTLGYDVAEDVVAAIGEGRSHILDVPSLLVQECVEAGRLETSTDAAELAACDTISICVPTPLSKTKDPDLSFIVAAAGTVAGVLRPGHLVILESTTFPGTTREVVLPILERSGLTVGKDFFLCFSPERVDPGNTAWTTKNTPKVIGGLTAACQDVGVAFYREIFDVLVPVPNTEAAELVKVYENTFRMINIALVNELAQVCERLGVDVWDVVDAAATKPFGFMKFAPGPGLGGHCIPLDPHYLAWKMKTLEFKTRMIEVASEVNAEMPHYVARKVSDALNGVAKPVFGSTILIVGVTYKKDVDDLRESPAIEIMAKLQRQGALVRYHDPYCPSIPADPHIPLEDLPLESVPLTDEVLQAADLVLIITDHTNVDYDAIAEHAHIVLDTRGAMRRVQPRRAHVIGLSGVVERPRRPHSLDPMVTAR